MNLFENLQIMKEVNENNIDELVRQAARLFSNDFTEKDSNESGYNKVIYGSKIDNEFTAIKKGLKSLGFKKLRGYPEFYNDYYRHSCGIDLMCQPLVKNVAKWNLRKQIIGFQFNYDTSMIVNESNEFIIKLPCEYMTDDEIKEYTNNAKNYSVGVQYKINGDDNSFIIISGSPENVKKYIDKEYLRFKDVVDDYEDDLRRAYIKYDNDASEDEIDNFLYESIRLNEMLSESKFKQPSRIKFTSEKLKQNNKLFDKISIQAELLLDNNGEYIVCLPGTKDWEDLIKEILDANIESIGSNI